MPAMCQVVGPSGSGKTLTLERTIRRLRRRGLRVAVLKHSHHRLAVEGKDTTRLRRSGSRVVLFASDECVLFSDWDPAELAAVLPVDVVLVEGFHRRRFPGPRFTVRDPAEADAIAERIDRAVGTGNPAVRLTADRRRTPRGDLWELAGNLMRRAGIRHLELGEPAPRATPHGRRPRARRRATARRR
jgi:molybdopterin-guanine dinucleotide biosynthesis adapter protein